MRVGMNSRKKLSEKEKRKVAKSNGKREVYKMETR